MKFITNNFYFRNFKIPQSNLNSNPTIQPRLRTYSQKRDTSLTLDLQGKRLGRQTQHQSLDAYRSHNKPAWELKQLLSKNQKPQNSKLWEEILIEKPKSILPKHQSTQNIVKNFFTESKQMSIQSLDFPRSENKQEDLNITFSVRTRQGQLVSNPAKVNQDTFMCHQNLCNIPLIHLFGVCDGHGQNGHFVSNFIKQHLPSVILTDPLLQNCLKSSLQKSIQIVASQANKVGFDTQYSGTTMVCVVISDSGRIICANIGDSRAVIGQKQGGIGNKFKAIPLSIDHKPNLPLEKKRITSQGGRVESYYDQAGNPIGPSRVWVGNNNFPGLAMSRSIGDQVAASVGVIDKPCLFKNLISIRNHRDQFMVIASDGVWEFLENKDVIDLVGRYYNKNDLDGACDELMKLSYKMWTKEDDSVVDDITLIIIFFNQQD